MSSNLHILKNYINHWFKAKGRHSIHSPFLFSLYENCISNIAKYPIDNSIEQIREKLLANDNSIAVDDLGAGSKIDNSHQRKISQIAKHSLKSKKEAIFLACFSKHISAQNIIELGTSFGTTALYIAKHNPKAKIHTIEGSAEIAKIATSNFQQLNFDNIQLHIGNFDDILPKLLNEITADIIFIDGNHTKEATLRYFEMALEKINPKGFMVFDDIYWSKGMTKAWKSIIKHPKVSISIDFFHLGIISIDQDFTKQDFRLRM